MASQENKSRLLIQKKKRPPESEAGSVVRAVHGQETVHEIGELEQKNEGTVTVVKNTREGGPIQFWFKFPNEIFPLIKGEGQYKLFDQRGAVLTKGNYIQLFAELSKALEAQDFNQANLDQMTLSYRQYSTPDSSWYVVMVPSLDGGPKKPIVITDQESIPNELLLLIEGPAPTYTAEELKHTKGGSTIVEEDIPVEKEKSETVDLAKIELKKGNIDIEARLNRFDFYFPDEFYDLFDDQDTVLYDFRSSSIIGMAATSSVSNLSRHLSDSLVSDFKISPRLVDHLSMTYHFLPSPETGEWILILRPVFDGESLRPLVASNNTELQRDEEEILEQVTQLFPSGVKVEPISSQTRPESEPEVETQVEPEAVPTKLIVEAPQAMSQAEAESLVNDPTRKQYLEGMIKAYFQGEYNYDRLRQRLIEIFTQIGGLKNIQQGLDVMIAAKQMNLDDPTMIDCVAYIQATVPNVDLDTAFDITYYAINNFGDNVGNVSEYVAEVFASVPNVNAHEAFGIAKTAIDFAQNNLGGTAEDIQDSLVYVTKLLRGVPNMSSAEAYQTLEHAYTTYHQFDLDQFLSAYIAYLHSDQIVNPQRPISYKNMVDEVILHIKKEAEEKGIRRAEESILAKRPEIATERVNAVANVAENLEIPQDELEFAIRFLAERLDTRMLRSQFDHARDKIQVNAFNVDGEQTFSFAESYPEWGRLEHFSLGENISFLRNTLKDNATLTMVPIDRGNQMLYLIVSRNKRASINDNREEKLYVLDGHEDDITTVHFSFTVDKQPQEANIETWSPYQIEVPTISEGEFRTLDQKFDYQKVLNLLSDSPYEATFVSSTIRKLADHKINAPLALRYGAKKFEREFPKTQEDDKYFYRVEEKMGQRVVSVYELSEDGANATLWLQIDQQIPLTDFEQVIDDLPENMGRKAEPLKLNQAGTSRLLAILQAIPGEIVQLANYNQAGVLTEYEEFDQDLISDELQQSPGEEIFFTTQQEKNRIVIVVEAKREGKRVIKYVLFKNKPPEFEPPKRSTKRYGEYEKHIKGVDHDNAGYLEDLEVKNGDPKDLSLYYFLDKNKDMPNGKVHKVAERRANQLMKALMEVEIGKDGRLAVISKAIRFGFVKTSSDEEKRSPAAEIRDKYIAVRSYLDDMAKSEDRETSLREFWGINITPEFKNSFEDWKTVLGRLKRELENKFDIAAEKAFLIWSKRYIQEQSFEIMRAELSDDETAKLINSLGLTDAERNALITAYLSPKEIVQSKVDDSLKIEALRRFATYYYRRYYQEIAPFADETAALMDPTITLEINDKVYDTPVFNSKTLPNLRQQADLLANAAVDKKEIDLDQLPDNITEAIQGIADLIEAAKKLPREKQPNRSVELFQLLLDLQKAIATFNNRRTHTFENRLAILNLLNRSDVQNAISTYGLNTGIQLLKGIGTKNFRQVMSETLNQQTSKFNAITEYYQPAIGQIRAELKAELIKEKKMDRSHVLNIDVPETQAPRFSRNKKIFEGESGVKYRTEAHILGKAISVNAISAITQIAQDRHIKTEGVYQDVVKEIGLLKTEKNSDWHDRIKVEKLEWNRTVV